MSQSEVKKVSIVLGCTIGIYLAGWVLFYAVFSGNRNTEAPTPPRTTLTAEAQEDKSNDNTLARSSNKTTSLNPASMPNPQNDPIPAHLETPSQLSNALSKTKEQRKSVDSSHVSTPNNPDSPPEPEQAPPGETPPGVKLGDKIVYTKCWDKNGLQHPGNKCDKLDPLIDRFSKRLYIVDQCRKAAARHRSIGHLRLGIEVDLTRRIMSIWNGSGSDIDNAVQITACLKEKLRTLSLDGLDSQFARYHVSVTVHFETIRKPHPRLRQHIDEPTAEQARQGRNVQVTKDHVRVRKQPVDGKIIGKISSGNYVILLEQQDDWCRVLTPRGNAGWMVCWALAL